MKVNSRWKSGADYRPDIDGLRAVAVLSVIVYHVEPSFIPGGFVGVDIFLVISGYLISRQIMAQLQENRFSLWDFYRRRVRRIAPAMLAVLGVTVLASQCLMRPSDAEAVARSGLWSLFGLANVFFWQYQDVGYFANASAELPLLHLWSLSLEEQFYFVWPWILLLTFGVLKQRAILVLLAFMLLISILIGEGWVDRDAAFAFYMLPGRMAALLVGCGLAVLTSQRFKVPSDPKFLQLSASLGALLLVLGFTYSDEHTFPGWQVLYPSLGAGLLIWVGSTGRPLESMLLRSRPMVLIGLGSYSAYLWHWPVLAYFRYANIEMTIVPLLIFGLITLVVSWLSYRFIELPFRRLDTPPLKTFMRLYILPGGVLALVCLVALRLDGYGHRWIDVDYRQQLASLSENVRPAFEYDYVCQGARLAKSDLVNDRCVVGTGEVAAERSAILIGDSNAAHYVGMLGVFATQLDYSIRNASVDDCPPIIGDPASFVTVSRMQNCREFLSTIWPVVQAYPVVVLSASWTSYAEKDGRFFDVLSATIQSLTDAGKVVIILGKAPMFPTYDRHCRQKALSLPFADCDERPIALSKAVLTVNDKLMQFALANTQVEYFDVTQHICPDLCSPYASEGRSFYFDTTHFSLPGSWQLGKELSEKGTPFPFSMVPTWLAERTLQDTSTINPMSAKL